MDRIVVAQPILTGNERRYVLDCLDTNWVSSNGKYIGLFESAFARYCNVKHAVAINTGTAALHAALAGLKLEPNDEVILPTVTFIATANAVRYCGARVVLADVLPGTLAIDPADVARKITARTKVIIPVHLYGMPANMKALNALAQKYGITVIEDAAEAHGARYRGQRVGGLGHCGIFSFYGNKILTTGEGGMVTTNDDALAARIRRLCADGMDQDKRYWFSGIGYNYRMTNVAAALGLAQLEQIDLFLALRADLAARYTRALQGLREHLILPADTVCDEAVNWMYTIYLRNRKEVDRDAVMRYLAGRGIETRPVFYPLHTMPPYQTMNQVFPVAEAWSSAGINLPTHLGLTEAELHRIVSALHGALHAVAPPALVPCGLQ